MCGSNDTEKLSRYERNIICSLDDALERLNAIWKQLNERDLMGSFSRN